jgi:general secretion pathway protein C
MTTAIEVKRNSKSAPVLAIAIAACLVLGAFAANQFWPLLMAFMDRSPPKVDAPTMTEVPTLPSIDPKLALIGTDASLSKTPLDLVLVATSPGRNASEGTAALGVDPRNPQTYVAGALLSNGARIVEVYYDRIVLQREGARAVLRLGSSQTSPLDQPGGLKGAFEKNPEASDPALLRVGGASRSPSSQAASVDEVSGVVRATPHFENGALAGFKLYPGERASSFAALGLKSGDIVRSVNGLALQSEAQWTEVAFSVADGNPVSVTIEREGSLMAMSLDAAAAAAAPPPEPVMPPTPPPAGGAR